MLLDQALIEKVSIKALDPKRYEPYHQVLSQYYMNHDHYGVFHFTPAGNLPMILARQALLCKTMISQEELPILKPDESKMRPLAETGFELATHFYHPENGKIYSLDHYLHLGLTRFVKLMLRGMATGLPYVYLQFKDSVIAAGGAIFTTGNAHMPQTRYYNQAEDYGRIINTFPDENQPEMLCAGYKKSQSELMVPGGLCLSVPDPTTGEITSLLERIIFRDAKSCRVVTTFMKEIGLTFPPQIKVMVDRAMFGSGQAVQAYRDGIVSGCETTEQFLNNQAKPAIERILASRPTSTI